VGTDGEKIKIWGDKWLPSCSTYQVISPRSFLDDSTTVDKLICRNTMTWDSDLLERLFLP
jgi:hypothetical protein